MSLKRQSVETIELKYMVSEQRNIYWNFTKAYLQIIKAFIVRGTVIHPFSVYNSMPVLQFRVLPGDVIESLGSEQQKKNVVYWVAFIDLFECVHHSFFSQYFCFFECMNTLEEKESRNKTPLKKRKRMRAVFYIILWGLLITIAKIFFLFLRRTRKGFIDIKEERKWFVIYRMNKKTRLYKRSIQTFHQNISVHTLYNEDL